jgi:hypothetical protein
VESLLAKLVFMLRRSSAVGAVVAVAIAVVAAKLHVSLGHSAGFWDGPL